MATLGDTSSAQSVTTAGRALWDDADAAAQRTTLGLGTLATQSGTFSGTSSGTNTGDQTGGTPAVVLGTANTAGSSANFLRRDDTILAFDATGPAAVGTQAVGAATTAARRDHVHATGAGTPTTQAFGDAAATGSGPAAAMTDHKHAIPALGTTAAAVGTSAGGSATTPSKSDHVHATGAGTPVTQAFGDAAAVGTGPAASMTDHVHGMPANPAQAFGRTVHGGTTDYSAPGIVITATGNTAQIANNLVYMFYYTPTSITIDQVAFNVTTGPASNANVRVGIYAADASWQCPTAPLADVTVAVASAFTGVKTITASATVNGRFIVAMNMDVAMTMRHWLGSLWTGSVDSALGTSNWIGSASVASTYGTMPSPGTAWTAALLGANGQVHNVLVRISVP